MSPLLGMLLLAAVWTIAIAIALHPRTRTYAFASWVVASVLAALLAPDVFLAQLPFAYKDVLTGLLQIAMFGMGATLTLADFHRILKMPWGVLIGFVLQFSVMPFLGWSVSNMLGLPLDLTLGMILVGASPGGISSNVVTYLARGNVALSVTMTACSTLAAPIMTPLMVYVYAREAVEIDYFAMFESILLTVVVPVVLGLIANAALTRMRCDPKRSERILAAISMIAICLICGLIAAKSQSQILQVGFSLLIAVTIHNIGGYLLGYYGAKLVRLDEADCRTIAIEVGLQNGGMAASLATEVLKRQSAAIAPALFAPVMNVTGSILAAIWSRSTPTVDPALVDVNPNA